MAVTPFPVLGRAFRIAPAQRGIPIASFWKFWIEGNELYAMNRDVGSMKVSIHASGQIHLRLGPRDLQPLAPPIALTGSDWRHALEIRYLIASDRSSPTSRKLKKKEKAYLIDTADGHALILNLLLTSTSPPPPTPGQFSGAETLWIARLGDGRHASLCARLTPLDRVNHDHLARLRGTEGPKVTLASTESASLKAELSHVFWGPDGNVILIAPAGAEIVRKLGPPGSLVSDRNKKRQPEVEYDSPNGSLMLRAPDGAIVGELVLKGRTGRITLSQNERVATELGEFQLRQFDENLRVGERFALPPLFLTAVPSIATRRPRQWSYAVHCEYDGSNLRVSIRPSSVGLLFQENDEMNSLEPHEEVIFTAPSSDIELIAQRGASPIVVPLKATLLLCDVDRH